MASNATPNGFMSDMAIEIERKFLVADDSWRSGVAEVRSIEQAYLAKTDHVSIRIRIDNGSAATLTIKSAEPGVERREYEYALPVADASELMQRREGAVIVKSRHLVRRGRHVWEVDVFEGENAGLVIAEVELARADEPIERPSWLGQEITHDRRFYNAELAKAPFARWRD